jgi:glyoxylase-like metal-dependent hydrolase (beta-lactamase superfamily II)
MSVHVGEIEVVPLVDAVGELGELAELFPGVAEEAWEPYRALYPSLFAGSRWRLPVASYLLRSHGRTVLVDTGVGPAGLWEWGAEREGGLPDALRASGTAPEEVDVVFLTHLHVDHVGWNADASATPLFPRARYISQPEAVAQALTSDRPHVNRCIRSLLERGLVDEVGAAREIAAGVTTVALPGHYPGHLGLHLESGGERAILIGDAAPNPLQLQETGERFLYESDPATAAVARARLLEEVVDRDVLVVCGHYPGGGIGRVTRLDERVVWEEAA